jgi:hypothetical protein
MTVDTIDFKKTIDTYRAKQREFRIVDVPDLQYVMIDGHGDPNTSPEFTRAIEALYPIACALKFHSKRELGRDFVVMPVEGLWWASDMDAFTAARDKSQWGSAFKPGTWVRSTQRLGCSRECITRGVGT